MKVWANSFKVVLVAIAASLLVSCAPTLPVREIIFEDQMTQLQTRSIQSRTFELTDRIKAMRAVITTLQDLEFVIDQADSRLGIITATKLKTYHLHITVKVNDRSSGRIRVRLQLSAGMYTLAEGVYQEFFTSLEKNFFLRAHYVPAPKSLAPTGSSGTDSQKIRLEKDKRYLADVPESVKSAALSLRKQPEKYLSETKIKNMLSQYDFFGSQLNPDSSFQNDYLDNQNGTITDKATGLMWQRSGAPRSLKNARANKYIERLNKELFAGYSDWRMPTIEELASLLQKDKNGGVYLDSVFDNQQIRCWSSDTAENMHGWKDTMTVWVLDYKYGKARRAYWWPYFEPGWASQNIQFPNNYVKAVRPVKY